MVQYLEIKEVETIIDKLTKRMACMPILATDITEEIYHLKKYHTILEGWYGDEQYHNKVEEGLDL